MKTNREKKTNDDSKQHVSQNRVVVVKTLIQVPQPYDGRGGLRESEMRVHWQR